METIIRIFEEKLTTDDLRYSTSSFYLAGRLVTFFPPTVTFYTQICLLLLFQMAAGCILATIMYLGIFRQSSVNKYLIGYGIVIPLALWFPFFLVESLDIRSVTCRLCLCGLPMILTLRCLETMHGFMAHQESLKEYVISVGFLLRPRTDPKTGEKIPLTAQSLMKISGKYFSWMLVLGVAYQFMSPSDFSPFPSVVNLHEATMTYDLATLYNSYIQLVLCNFSLAFSSSGIGLLAAVLTFVEFNTHVTDFPMFLSTSHSEFWGSRWNNLIHYELKQGIYKPVRRVTGSKTVAAICTFVVSGLQHEYVWWLLFTSTTEQLQETSDHEDGDCCRTCYCHAWFGRQLFLFSYAGLWMAIEYLVGTLPKFNNILLTLVESHLFLLVLFLPVAHNFTVDVTSSGYFHSLEHAFPLFVLQPHLT